MYIWKQAIENHQLKFDKSNAGLVVKVSKQPQMVNLKGHNNDVKWENTTSL